MSDSEDSTVTYTEVPPSPDYVPSLEHLPSPAPEFVLKNVYPEFMPLEDDVLPAKEQPLHAAVSPTADSPRYILESDLENGLGEDPEEDNEDPKEDPADYPTDREDDSEEEESSGEDANDEDEEEEDEEEEHPALADSVPPHTSCHTYSTTITTLFIVITTTPDTFTATLELSPSLPISHLPLPTSPTYPLGYRATMIRLRAESPSTFHQQPPIVLPHTRASMAMLRAATPSTYILATRSETPPSGTPPLLPIPLHASPLPLLLPSTDYRADVYEDTDKIYGRLDDARDDRLLMSSQLNMLCRDRRAHAQTARLMKSEARLSHEAWVPSMDASNTAHAKLEELQRLPNNNNIWSIIRKFMFGVVVYYIWQERNNRVFREEKRDEMTLVQTIKEIIQLRIARFAEQSKKLKQDGMFRFREGE
nr:reverse transcriptase zinc-binding domain-containing protein [Tanacetum cinerariifolium]